MIVYPNAKINLYLDVLGKRDDGFHEIETLMVPINIFDEMIVDKSEEDEVVCPGVPEEKNLVYKALKLFKKEFNIKECFKFILTKKIPEKAGLGGGSSDAAFAIKALCKMCYIDVRDERVMSIASQIGSDVPFFINNKPAIARGRGEKLETIEIKKIHGVLVFNGYEFSTKDVFSNFTCEKREKGTFIRNDLERAISIYKESDKVFEIKTALKKAGCYESGMSGSGSSVFGLCEGEEKALQVLEKIKSDYLFAVAFKSL